MARLVHVVVFLAFCLTLAAQAAAQEPCAGSLDAQPSVIPIDLWYGGATVRVNASVPAGARLALVLQGPREHVALHKKGKVFGLLWMNVGDVELDDVPSAYMLATTVPMAELGPQETLRGEAVGYPGLSVGVRGEADAFAELVKLKEEEGLYAVKEGALPPVAGGGATATLAYDIPISARMPEGKYTVRLVEFGAGEVRCLASTTVTLNQAGAAKSLRELAFGHGLLYGIAAVVTAIVAGLGTGLVFGKGSSKGH